MTTLLGIESVSKVYPDGADELVVLDRVSFELQAGGQLGLIGAPRSGKSTLLRIAAGIEAPDRGQVLLEGSDIAHMGGAARARLLRRAIGYVALSDWQPMRGESALDHVATALGSDGFTPKEARNKAARVLERVEIDGACRHAPVGSLGICERTRLALARALVREPRLLVVDEPAIMPSVTEYERFSQMLRAVTDERSIALLVASAELSALGGLQLMSISDGELCCTAPGQTNVVRLPFRTAPIKHPVL